MLLAAAALACLALAVLLPERGSHRRGDPAPALRDASSGIDLERLRGRPVLVEFFASWCPPCVHVAPVVAEAHARGLAVVGVALEHPETVSALDAFRSRHGIVWPVAVLRDGFDHPLVADWRVRSIPALFLVGADGSIAASGLVGADADATRARLRQALDGLDQPR